MRFRRGLKTVGIGIALNVFALMVFRRFGVSPETHLASPSPTEAEIEVEASIRTALSEIRAGTATDPPADFTDNDEEAAPYTLEHAGYTAQSRRYWVETTGAT